MKRSEEMEDFFVYVLRSVNHPDKTYVGFTKRLSCRLDEHNEGSQTYSRRYAPWEELLHIAFHDKEKALEFEKYLKTPSGKAFLKHHLL